MIDFSLIEDDSEKVEFMNSMFNLVKDGECTPDLLNTALVNYASISAWLITVLESVERENNDLKNEYNVWIADKFIEVRNKLSENIAKSKMPSQTEITNQVIVENREEYLDWQKELQIHERKEGFYRRMNDMWKTNANMILALCNNARSELFALKIEDKANQDITKENLIRHNKIKKVVKNG